jgi:hypothetical protein
MAFGSTAVAGGMVAAAVPVINCFTVQLFRPIATADGRGLQPVGAAGFFGTSPTAAYVLYLKRNGRIPI